MRLTLFDHDDAGCWVKRQPTWPDEEEQMFMVLKTQDLGGIRECCASFLSSQAAETTNPWHVEGIRFRLRRQAARGRRLQTLGVSGFVRASSAISGLPDDRPKLQNVVVKLAPGDIMPRCALALSATASRSSARRVQSQQLAQRANLYLAWGEASKSPSRRLDRGEMMPAIV